MLDGVYWYLRSSLTGGIGGSAVTTFIGLALAVILAGAVTWFLSTAVQRELTKALKAAPSATGDAS